jgi:hypothetical protein
MVIHIKHIRKISWFLPSRAVNFKYIKYSEIGINMKMASIRVKNNKPKHKLEKTPKNIEFVLSNNINKSIPLKNKN